MRIQSDLLRGLFRKFRTQAPSVGAELREGIQPVSTVDMTFDEITDFEQWNRGPAASTLPRQGITWRTWDVAGAGLAPGTDLVAITFTKGLWRCDFWVANTEGPGAFTARADIELVEGGAVTMGLRVASTAATNLGMSKYPVVVCAETTGTIIRLRMVDAGVGGRHFGSLQAWRTWTDDRAF